jgi:hypothetical protein
MDAEKTREKKSLAPGSTRDTLNGPYRCRGQVRVIGRRGPTILRPPCFLVDCGGVAIGDVFSIGYVEDGDDRGEEEVLLRLRQSRPHWTTWICLKHVALARDVMRKGWAIEWTNRQTHIKLRAIGIYFMGMIKFEEHHRHNL